ncbi:2EXR domain-containing protein [Aspergillus stella-maris]|uniref:2EXR domain-containing protein n=1 Tax=Aspergillus stella-maris TaxID=1810926 RepID=UPI003CCE12F9
MSILTPPHNETTTINSLTHTEFHPFPFLPTELRLLIWNLTLAEPRTVHLKCHRAVHPLMKRRFAVSFESLTPPPALMLVNREARGVALVAGGYRKWFQVDEDKSIYFIAGPGAEQNQNQHQHQKSQPPPTQTPAPQPPAGPSHPSQSESPQPIFISFTLDTFHLREDVLAYIPSTERSLVERMIVDVADVHYFGHFYLDVIRSMSRLRTLDLVVGFRESDWVLVGRDAENGHGNGDGGLAGAGAGTDPGLAHGRLQRGLGLLEDEFLEMKGRYPDWRVPDVRVLMRGTGDVLARFSTEEGMRL